MTETLLLTWILLVFIGAIYQLFLVNQTLFSSMARVHARLFEQAFSRNCADARPDCEYSSDLHGGAARVIWRPSEIPEVNVPLIGMFRQSLPTELRIESRRYGAGSDHACPGRPCKRTKLGSGAYVDPITGILQLPQIVFRDGFLSSYLDGLDVDLLDRLLGGILDELF